MVPATSAPLLACRKRENILAAETRASLLPVLAVIAREEHATEFAVVHHADVDRVRIFLIGNDGRHVTMRVAVVRCRPGPSRIQSEHAAAVGRQQNVAGVARIDVDVIDHDFRIADPLPGLAQIHRLPQTFGGSGVDDVFVGGILLQHARTARRERNALDLGELLARAHALVDARACAGKNVRGIGVVDDDRKHIGIVDHALVDVLPVGAAIGSLPREVPRAGVHDVGILRVNRDRLDVLDFGMACGRHALPIVAAVVAAEYAIERARYQNLGFEADIAIARIDLPCIAGRVCHVLPPSLVRKMSPICWLCALQAETYMMLVFCGLTTM